MSGLKPPPSQRRTPFDDSRTCGAAADGGRGIYGIVYVDKLLESTMIATQRERIALRTDEHTVGSHERCALVVGAPSAPAVSTLAPEICTPPPTPWRHDFRRLQPVSPTSAPPDLQYVRVVATHANDPSPAHRVFTQGIHTGYDRRCMTVVLISAQLRLNNFSATHSILPSTGTAATRFVPACPALSDAALQMIRTPPAQQTTRRQRAPTTRSPDDSTLRVAPQTRSCVVHI